ncbi:hypothetical protein NPIL_114701 [Nephila pilipes]|uniref:Uncharacterized protein n=1 Tax=Nephila pilipes TaxID=299642 RepID=A0A8X6PI39_NEPPI|nr:hypothetical protein NPIL_114701 [Nephila pilipes]
MPFPMTGCGSLASGVGSAPPWCLYMSGMQNRHWDAAAGVLAEQSCVIQKAAQQLLEPPLSGEAVVSQWSQPPNGAEIAEGLKSSEHVGLTPGCCFPSQASGFQQLCLKHHEMGEWV